MNQNPYDGISEVRKEMARKSLRFFATTYFKHYCKVSFAPFHLELFDYLTEMTLDRGRQLAIAAPRSNAKSSIVSLMYVLWCACYGHEKCIVIFSSTRDQSEKLLSHIKEELSLNKDLMRDFPEVCERPNPRWRNDEIITKNKVNIISSSVEHGIRGVRYQESRPGLVILDDAETAESIRSQEQREKIHDWFTRVVLNLGSESTNYIVVGTILHFDSLLAKIISQEEFPGWEKKIYKSVVKFSNNQHLWDTWERIYCDKELYNGESGSGPAKKFFESNKDKMLEGTEVLWPAKESYCDLMLMRAQKGSLSFDSEKQNEPRDTSGLSIDMKKVIFWDDHYQTIEDLQAFLGTRKAVLGACDPAVKKGKKNDYSAIVCVFMDTANKTIYVIDADVGRWGVDELVDRICLSYKIRNFAKFVYEANAAQAWLGDIIQKAPTTIPLEPVTNMMHKDLRIMKLMVLIERGRVRLSRRLTELLRELEQHPYGAHDDAIDALSMIVDIAEKFALLTPEIVKAMFAGIHLPAPEAESKRIFKFAKGPYKHYSDFFKH